MKWLRLSALFNWTTIIHMATSVSRWLNISCMMFNIKAFSVPSVICEGWHFTHKRKPLTRVWANQTSVKPLTRVWANQTSVKPLTRVWANQTSVKPRTRIWANQTGVKPPLLIEVHVTSQGSARSYTWLLGVAILPLSTILELLRQCGIFMFLFLLQWLLSLYNVLSLQEYNTD